MIKRHSDNNKVWNGEEATNFNPQRMNEEKQSEGRWPQELKLYVKEIERRKKRTEDIFLISVLLSPFTLCAV